MLNYIKVALVTPKVCLGNPLQNANEILKAVNKQKNADILVFPELSITGYSLGDWVFNRELLEQAKLALKKLVEASTKQVMIVGMPLEVTGAIYNCAVVIQNKKILGIIPKVNLPDSGEFYEKRFFTSGKKFLDKPIQIDLWGDSVKFGQQIFYNPLTSCYFGVEICGDLFGQSNPHQFLYQNGADVVFNISASTYHLHKKEIRLHLINDTSYRFKGTYLYVSNGPSDSTSDMTYSGHQIASVCGDTIFNKETLSLDTVINVIDVDIDSIRFVRYSDGYAKGQSHILPEYTPFDIFRDTIYQLEKLPDTDPFVPKKMEDFEEIIDVTTTCLKHRLDYVGVKKVVIGISGGLDSTLALLFCYSCFKKYGLDVKGIIAVTMPGLGTGSKSKNIARNLMNKLGVDAREVSIKKEAMLQLKALGHGNEEKDVTYENVQARLRTMYLMNLANLEKGIVIGTGDLSEIALGWSTFNGDQMAMYNLNANLPKTMVKALVQYYINVFPQVKLELKKVYRAIITPELTGSDQATEDKIGKYQINDFIMYHIFVEGASKEKIVYLVTQVFKLTDEEAGAYYDRFMNRFKHNQYKRLASPEGIKIYSFTLCARGEYRFPGDMK